MHVKRHNPDFIVASDASGKWDSHGANGFNSSGVQRWEALKNFITIVLAGAVWGEQWTGKTVLPQCDNMAVAVIINSGSSKDADVMHLMRCLAFAAAKFNFVIVSRHIRGVDNDLTE